MASPKRQPGEESVDEYRARMRALGLKPVVIWVPDTDAVGFDEEARRQSGMSARSLMAEDDQAFVDSLADELFKELDAEGL